MRMHGLDSTFSPRKLTSNLLWYWFGYGWGQISQIFLCLSIPAHMNLPPLLYCEDYRITLFKEKIV